MRYEFQLIHIVAALYSLVCAFDKSLENITECVLPEDSVILRIGTIYPLSGDWAGGLGCKPAAKLALAHVNCHPTKPLLNNYKLEFSEWDSNCDPGRGTFVLYHFLYREKQIIALLGPGCSSVSTAVAEAAHLWNLLIVSYGSSSPALSNSKRFPTFFRTHPSATIHNPTRISLFKKFGWTRIYVLLEMIELFTATMNDLYKLAEKEGISVQRVVFQSHPKNAIQNLKRMDARIIVGLFYAKVAQEVFCEAYKANLYGPKIVWFILGWFPDDWYKAVHEGSPINCTEEEMVNATQSHFTTEIQQLDLSVKETYSNFSPQSFDRLIRLNPGSNVDGFPESSLAYDAVWALAIAINQTIADLMKLNQTIEKEFRYNAGSTFKYLRHHLEETNFTGVSGHVSFNKDGDRLASVNIEVMRDGKYYSYGVHNPNSGLNLSPKPHFKNWPFDKSQIPKDGVTTVHELSTISMHIFVPLSILIWIDLLMSFGFLLFNYIYRNNKVVKNSQPFVNSIMLIGCIISLLAMFINGFSWTMDGVFPQYCQVMLWCLTIGFTLGFGSLFSKIWCLHTSASGQGKSKKKNTMLTTSKKNKVGGQFKPVNIYVALGFLLLIDLIFLTVYAISHPMFKEKLEMAEESVSYDEDLKVVNYIEHCRTRSYSVWIGTLFGYKGLLLLLGAFLAYDTRNTHLKEINDSKNIGLCIYNIVVLLCITAPVTLLIKQQQDAAYAFSSLAVLICTAITELMVFLPKIVAIRLRKETTVPGSDKQAPNKQEEERYKKLIAENEIIKKNISEREEYIVQLKIKLEHLIEAKLQAKVHNDPSVIPLAKDDTIPDFYHVDINPEEMSASEI